MGRVLTLQDGEGRYEQGHVGGSLRYARVSEKQLSLPHGRGRHRYLWQLQRRGHVSVLQRGLGRQAVGWQQALHDPLRARPVAARECLLVADDVQAAGKLTGRKSDQPLPAQLADVAAIHQGRGRRLHVLRPERVTWKGQGSELASRPQRAVPGGLPDLLAN